MRAFVSALKYLPSALAVVLLVALIISPYVSCSIQTHYNSGWGYELKLEDGCVSIGVPEYVHPMRIPPYFFLGQDHQMKHPLILLGKFEVLDADDFPLGDFWKCSIPLLAIVTILLPFAVGPFLKYRFPLWSWFVYMALLAGEMAIYLR